ncbi:MAG TPA: hypothetical protein PKY82_19535, partial [Pyrinomonadaceae bacterium]|nr:hypothetical protein [Pyrinomonadaceae bacterium]
MRLFWLFCIFLLLLIPLSAQTPCGDLATQPGKWVQTPPTGKDVQAIKNINTAMSLFQRSVTGFTGGQAKTYTFTADLVDVPGKKFQGYTAAMLFLQFECIKGVIKPEAATDTWLYIGFNEFPFFRSNNIIGILQNCAEGFYCLPNGQQMYLSNYLLKDIFKGYPKLTPLHDPAAEAVFLSKSGQLPLRSVSEA